jgi:ribosomal protein L34
MHVKVRSSKSKRLKKTGFLSRQRSKGGRKMNRRQRARHGSF